jgi:hypothetical protein
MKNPQKSPAFFCEKCDYITCNTKDYKKHCDTIKHRSVTNPNEILTKNPQKSPYHNLFICLCGKSYSHKTSLSTHKKKCKIVHNETSLVLQNGLNKDDLLKYLMKENSEFKEMLLDQNKMIMKVCEKDNSNINNTHINSHNKTFNLNVFLNEQCKDAMNMTDFVESLQLQLADLETVGKLGFVEGISNIIIQKLKAMDIYKRPVHCSDSKREVMYVKDEDKWEKECKENNKLRKAIKRIAYKNTKMLSAFREKHPDCGKSDSKYSDQYNKLVIEAMGGKGDNDTEKENKIIRNIAKEVIIEK